MGERGEKTADSTSVADHQDWNSGSKKLARATSTAIGDRAKLYFIFEMENDIGTKQIRYFEAGASRRRISILHRNERFPVYGIYFD